ncbi:hypothetical protein IFVP203_C2190275 [Vibrio parahaemolyticus]
MIFWNSLNLFIKRVSSNTITRKATRIGLNTQQLANNSATLVYYHTLKPHYKKSELETAQQNRSDLKVRKLRTYLNRE